MLRSEPPGCQPITPDGLGKEKQPLEIHVEQSVPVLFGDLRGCLAAIRGGRVHQDIDLAHLREDIRYQCLDVAHTGDVGWEHLRGSAVGAKFSGTLEQISVRATD
jgi:hypothetical protein